MKSYIQVSTTTESKEQAKKIADFLVGQKLAACVQILGPIESRYR
jgi:periplasmic divalent cation tolerance protein